MWHIFIMGAFNTINGTVMSKPDAIGDHGRATIPFSSLFGVYIGEDTDMDPSLCHMGVYRGFRSWMVGFESVWTMNEGVFGWAALFVCVYRLWLLGMHGRA